MIIHTYILYAKGTLVRIVRTQKEERHVNLTFVDGDVGLEVKELQRVHGVKDTMLLAMQAGPEKHETCSHKQEAVRLLQWKGGNDRDQYKYLGWFTDEPPKHVY